MTTTEHRTITLEELNAQYGQYGRTFKTRTEAYDFSDKHKGSHVTRLSDYKANDIEEIFKLVGTKLRSVGCKPREGAQSFCIGWLVTLAAK